MIFVTSEKRHFATPIAMPCDTDWCHQSYFCAITVTVVGSFSVKMTSQLASQIWCFLLLCEFLLWCSNLIPCSLFSGLCMQMALTTGRLSTTSKALIHRFDWMHIRKSFATQRRTIGLHGDILNISWNPLRCNKQSCCTYCTIVMCTFVLVAALVDRYIDFVVDTSTWQKHLYGCWRDVTSVTCRIFRRDEEIARIWNAATRLALPGTKLYKGCECAAGEVGGLMAWEGSCL